MKPIPPSLAIAIAILDSVTVSIAADKIGMFNSKFFVSLVLSTTLLGTTSDFFGTNKTSSNVKPSNIFSLPLHCYFPPYLLYLIIRSKK